MTRRPRQNFSGCRAVLFHKEDRSHRVLAETLTRLGLQVESFVPGAEEQAARAVESADVFFFDADLAETPQLRWTDAPRMPIVAAIGLETPGRLQRAFELGASIILHKPVHSSGIYSALFFAFNEHRRRFEMAERLRELEARHGARRFVLKAILRLMERHGCDDEAAYRLLRKESMRRRVTVEEVAVRILADGPSRIESQA